MKRIIYQKLIETGHGTEEAPDIEQVLENHGMVCQDADLDACLAAVKAVAYNGEVTVKDVEDAITEPTRLDVIEAQAAYTAMMTGTLLEV